MNSALAISLHDEAITILGELLAEGSDWALGIAERLQTTVIPTIVMGEDLELADELLDEVAGDIIAMAAARR